MDKKEINGIYEFKGYDERGIAQMVRVGECEASPLPKSNGDFLYFRSIEELNKVSNEGINKLLNELNKDIK